MASLRLDLPDDALAALKDSPDRLSADIRLAAAAAWYEQGRMSQEMAARVAGLDRTAFLLALARMGRNAIQVDLDDLDRELARD